MFERDATFSGAGEESVGAPIDALSAAIGAIQLELLRQIAQLPTERDWEAWGAKDHIHWLGMRMGTFYWKASRLCRAATELQRLPGLSRALASGQLNLDKVLELARFATAADEAELISWAETLAPVVIRQDAERRTRLEANEVREIERQRSVHWWSQEGTFGLEARLPAAQGATVAKALERMAEAIPVMPGEEGSHGVEQRRADALVALCAGRLSSDADPDRATVVIHARLEDLRRGGANAEIEGGGVVDPVTVSRLLCDARVQTMIHNATGGLVEATQVRREPPPWLVRAVRQRDKTCRFPGCDAKRFTQVHHIRFWANGGLTRYKDLALLCFWHHRLLHEHGWRLKRRADGSLRWFWPDGRPHRDGHSPLEEEREAIGRRLARFHRPPRRPELRRPPAPEAIAHPPARRALMFSRT